MPPFSSIGKIINFVEINVLFCQKLLTIDIADIYCQKPFEIFYASFDAYKNICQAPKRFSIRHINVNNTVNQTGFLGNLNKNTVHRLLLIPEKTFDNIRQ